MNDEQLRKSVEKQVKRMRRADKERSSLLAQSVYLGTLTLLFVLPVIVGAYLGNMEAARLFFIEQDKDYAPERFRKLKAELREMVTLLNWSPASGHPARFFTGRSAQARLRVQAVQQLAA